MHLHGLVQRLVQAVLGLVQVLLIVKISLAGGWLVVGVGHGWGEVSVVSRRSLIPVPRKHLVCGIPEVVGTDIVVVSLLLLLLLLFVVLVSAKLLLSLIRVQALKKK